MSNIVDIDLLNLRQGIDALYKAVESIATREAPLPKIPLRSLSGDHLNGGKIVHFESVGIKDDATKTVLLVNDKGVHADRLNVKTLLGDTQVGGSLFVNGEVTAKKLHVDELTADVRVERSTPIEFHPEADKGIYGKGLIWKDPTKAKQLVYRANPDRLWTTESIDLDKECFYAIDNVPVLRATELGSTVRTSSLVKVGTLQNLSTSGNLTVDEYMFYESSTQRLGLGTDAPNGALSIASLGGELILDVDANTRIGNWTTTDLELITDNTARITIGATGNITIGAVDTRTTVQGKLGVNVKNPDCDIVTAGPVKFQGKRQEVAEAIPTSGAYKKGDIVWNANPKPTGYVGWICVRDGTPGEWKPFGQIAA